MTTETLNRCREAFETWWKEANPCNSLERDKANLEHYFTAFAQYGWQAWHARDEEVATLNRLIENEQALRRSAIPSGTLIGCRDAFLKAFPACSIEKHKVDCGFYPYERASLCNCGYEDAQDAYTLFKSGWEAAQPSEIRNPLFARIPDVRPIESAYLALLKLSPIHDIRALNQGIYATLRDAIAASCGETPEDVQTTFEAFAAQDVVQREIPVNARLLRAAIYADIEAECQGNCTIAADSVLHTIRPYLKQQAQPAGEIPADIESQNMALVPLMVMAASEFDADALGIANLDRLMTDALSAIRPHLREPKREAQPAGEIPVINDEVLRTQLRTALSDLRGHPYHIADEVLKVVRPYLKRESSSGETQDIELAKRIFLGETTSDLGRYIGKSPSFVRLHVLKVIQAIAPDIYAANERTERGWHGNKLPPRLLDFRRYHKTLLNRIEGEKP